jgi:hypothetical protein
MLLTELPRNARKTNAHSTETGTDRKTASVARMLPRKIRISRHVSTRPRLAPASTVTIAAFTNKDWSNTTFAFNPCGTSKR